MKNLLLTIMGFCCLTFAQAQTENTALPSTVIKDLKTGNKVEFKDIIQPGKVTLISFWATWCVPCRKEIKNVSRNLKEWQEETDFEYITVSMDESRSEGAARGYSISQGWEFPSYIDVNSDLKRSLAFDNIPFAIIVDKNGKIIMRHSAYEEGGEYVMYDQVKEAVAAK